MGFSQLVSSFGTVRLIETTTTNSWQPWPMASSRTSQRSARSSWMHLRGTRPSFRVTWRLSSASSCWNPVQEAIRRNVPTDDWGRLISIDGLDECKREDQNKQREILKTIDKVFFARGVKFPFLIALSSRPEAPVREALESLFTGHLIHIDLNDEKYQASADILEYFRQEFEKIRTLHKLPNADWPCSTELQSLVANASGQFIYAATVIKFIAKGRMRLDERLKMVLLLGNDSTIAQNPLQLLDQLYKKILQLAQNKYAETANEVVDHLAVVKMVRYIALAKKERLLSDDRKVEEWRVEDQELAVTKLEWPTQQAAFKKFLDVKEETLHATFYDIHSLVDTKTWAFYHRTLTDFLSDKNRCEEHFVSPESIRRSLVLCALRVLRDPPSQLSGDGDFKVREYTLVIGKTIIKDAIHTLPVDSDVIDAMGRLLGVLERHRCDNCHHTGSREKHVGIIQEFQKALKEAEVGKVLPSGVVGMWTTGIDDIVGHVGAQGSAVLAGGSWN
ncbi:hypothetical protein CC2G_008040 [Coprinopsis cinerea AmutBmut pab1-1]|nr:hypothetical protein CC2G_008040 [Coprinopsis cinerea AmutBmut pab1-1]